MSPLITNYFLGARSSLRTREIMLSWHLIDQGRFRSLALSMGVTL